MLTVIADGAMGTMLLSRGVTDTLRAPVERPDEVTQIHKEYLEAGADVVRTATILVNPLETAGWEEIARAAVRCARAAGAERILASVGPTRLSISRRQVSFATFGDACREMIKLFREEGAEGVHIETVTDTLNAAAAADAAQSVDPGMTLWMSAAADGDGKLPSGETVEKFIDMANDLHPAAAGLNCGLSTAVTCRLMSRIEKFRGKKLLIPSAGVSGNLTSPEEFARLIKEAAPDIAGGCCNTNPDYIRALRRILP